MTFDIAIVGAGVVGCALARELARYDLSVVLIDAEADVAMGASRANSALVHAGYDCEPGSLMALMNVRGNELYTAWCRDLSVPLKRIGSFVVGFDEADGQVLRKLLARGLANGVPDLALISGDEARKMEPSLSEDVTLALYAPTAGITCPYEFTMACAENARANGCRWLLNAPVTAIRKESDRLTLTAGGETVSARFVVNAAGIFADEIAALAGDRSLSIRPRKGEYLLFDRTAPSIGKIIFQTPSALGKGVLVAPTVDGNSFVGPTAVDQDDKTDLSVSAASIDNLKARGHRSVPGLDFGKVITSFAGLRAITDKHDFIIGMSASCDRLLNLAGICSPGLTSAPAIAEYAVTLLAGAGLVLCPRQNYQPRRPKNKRFAEMTDEERHAAIAENPLYSRIVCRCETVTEAEIVDAVKRGATTLDGVKRRTRAGMGRCQSGFCTPRVMEILSRELGVPFESVTKFGRDSKMVFGKTR